MQFFTLQSIHEMCCVQLPSRLTSFKSMSIKPYFQSENTHDCNVKPDEPEAPLPTLEVPWKPTEPAIKCG